MIHAVVTGATSFLGRPLVQGLLAQGYLVTAVVRPSSKNLEKLPIHTNLQVIELDMHHLGHLADVTQPANALFHLAWDGIRGIARGDEGLQNQNVEWAYTAACVAAKLKCDVFMGCGSQAEYGPKKGAISEQLLPEPDTAYGRAKLIAGIETQRVAKQHAMRFVWPRIFSLYGPGDFDEALLPYALRNMALNLPLELTACTQNWNFLHVDDAANALLLLAQNPVAEGIFNLAGKDTRPLRAYIEEMKVVVGSSSELHFASASQAVALAGFDPVIERLQRLCAWNPGILFATGIFQMYDDMRKKYEND